MPTPSPLAQRLAGLLPLALYAASVTGFLVHSPYAASDFPLDDAWIERVYARSFAFGHGFAYNDGVQEAGITTPLWAVVSAPSEWLGFLGGVPTVVLGVKIIGILLGGVAVFALGGIAQGLTGSRAAAAISACLLAVEPRLLFAALSGTEVTLLVALWLAATHAVLAKRALLALVLLGLTPLTRPEALLLLPLALLGIALLHGPRDHLWRRPAPWLALALPSLLWGLYCQTVTGHWLTNTAYLKMQPFSLGLAQARIAWAAVSQYGWGSQWVFDGGLVLFAVFALMRRERRPWVAALLLAAAPLVFLAGVVGSRALSLEGYYWTRWSDPAAIVLTALFALGLAAALAARLDVARLKLGLAALSAAGLLFALPGLAESYGERRARLSSDSRAIRLINVEPALWIRNNTPADAVVGVNDAGAFRYFGQRRTIDLVGLNNADIAFGRVPLPEIIAELDWLAVFPGLFEPTGLLELFERRQVFTIPLAEYTICRCPTQTTQWIGERRAASP